MDKVLVYAIILAGMLGFISCDKGDDPDPGKEVVKTILISVKHADGTAAANQKVYLFAKPATEADGKNPSKALKSATTTAAGIASFDVQNHTAFQEGATLYATILEQISSSQFNVLGTVSLTKGTGTTLEAQISLPAPPDPGEPNESGPYAYGFMPTTLTSEYAMQEYNRWKTTQVVPCGDGLRVVSDDRSITLVEAMGFGTLLAAYANDKATFDGLIRFYKARRTVESKNMMGWKVSCTGAIDPGSATDGDVDVAFALIVAHKQWGEQAYLDDAKAILQIVKDHVFFTCPVNGRDVLVLGPGYSGRAWGGCGEMDIMYHTPAFFRIFAEVTGDAAWATLAEDTYTTLAAGANATTGLVPDWQTATGTPGPNGRAGHFGYDACRAPWRLSLDYLWNGNQKAKDWAIKVSNWANGVGPANIKDGYELDGRARGQNHNSSFVGGFAVASMCNSQSMADAFGTEMKKLEDTYWFNLNTRVLYLFTQTGNFWDPTAR